METDQSDIDLIERYIHGKLTPDEVDVFEHRLVVDREFARKYRLRKTFPEMMREANDVEPEKTAIENPALPVERRFSFHNKNKYLVPGAIGVIIIGTLLYFMVMHRGGDPAMMNQIPSDEAKAIQQEKRSESTAESIRVESARRKPVELNSPDDGVTFSRKDEILFTWELETDTFTNLYVFSEISHKLFWWRGIKPGIRENKVPARNFLPGKFYWYVGSKEFKRTFIIEE